MTTTTTQLTPSQATFKFFDDLFINPALLADYYEQALTVNGQKYADEVLTQWMANVGYAGATPGLVYQALQFWQAQGLWFWQGEYNQSFYYPPDNAPVQANQYILKVLPDGNDGFEVTLNGEVLDYTLTVDQGYLVLSWYYADNESIKNSVTFYYSPSFSIKGNNPVQYAGNFFSGYLSGNIFKGALLSQSNENSTPQKKHWYDLFTTTGGYIAEVILAALFIGGGYTILAKKYSLWPLNQSNPVLEKEKTFQQNIDQKVENIEQNEPLLDEDQAQIQKRFDQLKNLQTELEKEGLYNKSTAQLLEEKYPYLITRLKGKMNLDRVPKGGVDQFRSNLQNEYDALIEEIEKSKTLLKVYNSPESIKEREKFKLKRQLEDVNEKLAQLDTQLQTLQEDKKFTKFYQELKAERRKLPLADDQLPLADDQLPLDDDELEIQNLEKRIQEIKVQKTALEAEQQKIFLQQQPIDSLADKQINNQNEAQNFQQNPARDEQLLETEHALNDKIIKTEEQIKEVDEEIKIDEIDADFL